MGRSPAYAKEYAAVRALVKRLVGCVRGTCNRAVEAMVARTSATLRSKLTQEERAKLVEEQAVLAWAGQAPLRV